MPAQTNFPLHFLDQHTLLQTMLKMPVGTVCRMRQTCSEINRFVVKRKKQMSNRTLDYGNSAHISLEFTVDESANVGSTLLRKSKTEEDFFRAEETFSDEKILGQISEILSRFDLSCCCLQLGSILPEWIVKITNVVNARYVSLERHFGEAEDYLKIIRKVRNPSKLSVTINGSKVKFDSVKCFDFFAAYDYTAEWFHRFLWEMYSSKDQKTYLTYLSFCCSLHEIAFEKSVIPSPPPNVLLWMTKDTDAYHSSFRIIDLNSKYAFLSELNNDFSAWDGEEGIAKQYTIHFVDKNSSAVLDKILERFYMDIDWNLREEFISCNDQRKTEIIEEIYKKYKKNREERFKKALEIPNVWPA